MYSSFFLDKEENDLPKFLKDSTDNHSEKYSTIKDKTDDKREEALIDKISNDLKSNQEIAFQLIKDKV